MTNPGDVTNENPSTLPPGAPGAATAKAMRASHARPAAWHGRLARDSMVIQYADINWELVAFHTIVHQKSIGD